LTKAKVEGVVTQVARMGQRFVHIIMNQEFTKVKVEGAVMEVARMGQQINHMDEKFDKMEKKMDKLLIQRFATNFSPLNPWC